MAKRRKRQALLTQLSSWLPWNWFKQSDNHSDNQCDNQSDNHSDNQCDNQSDNQCDNHSDNQCDSPQSSVPLAPVPEPAPEPEPERVSDVMVFTTPSKRQRARHAIPSYSPGSTARRLASPFATGSSRATPARIVRRNGLHTALVARALLQKKRKAVLDHTQRFFKSAAAAACK